MDYTQLSDTELIDLFLKHKPEQAAIRDELFSRYYEQFDQRIRAVLHTRGLPYSPGEFYYNEIFVDVYQQVFDLGELEAILQKYELKKGKFTNWFLNYVVVNRVRDWLKKLDKPSGRKNIERLKESIRQEHRQLSLNESIGNEGNGLTLVEIIPAETELQDEEHQQAISSAIQQLPSTQQLMLRLLFLAYQEIPEQDLAYLTAELHLPVSALRKRLEQICQGLKKSPKYEQSEMVELSLACLAQQEDCLQRKLKNIESELEALFPDKEIPRADVQSQLLSKDMAQARQELDQSYQRRQLEGREYRWRSLLLQHQHIAKQLSKTFRKRTQLAQEYNSGKYFVFPSYKQLAQVLNLSEGTVASRINRTVNHLRKLLDMEENGEKFRIRKVENLYRRNEEYVE